MSVIPDIILHKVCQVYMCYTIRSLFLSFLQTQEGLKKIRAPKIFTCPPVTSLREHPSIFCGRF